MKVKCPRCKAVSRADDSKIPDKGIYGRCPKCRNRFLIRKEDGLYNPAPWHEKAVCPHCHHERSPEDVKCPKCAVIYEKYERIYSPINIKGGIERSKETKQCEFTGNGRSQSKKNANIAMV
ncbi:MAG: hypothetical protein GY846_17395 [Deltaproteobacteria bacterium]|nr:hypothetical protein [Deltaproteobacteria bacterium]